MATMKRTISIKPATDAILTTLAKDGGRTRSGQIEYIIAQWIKMSKGGRSAS